MSNVRTYIIPRFHFYRSSIYDTLSLASYSSKRQVCDQLGTSSWSSTRQTTWNSQTTLHEKNLRPDDVVSQHNIYSPKFVIFLKLTITLYPVQGPLRNPPISVPILNPPEMKRKALDLLQKGSDILPLVSNLTVHALNMNHASRPQHGFSINIPWLKSTFTCSQVSVLKAKTTNAVGESLQAEFLIR